MSGAESEPRTEAEAGGAPIAPAERRALTESDADETPMTYGRGRVPWYVAALWALAAVGLAAYAVRFVVPAVTAWGAP